MRHSPMAALAAVVLAIVPTASSSRGATPPTCVYDAATRTVTWHHPDRFGTPSIGRSGDAIVAGSSACGAATVTNTDLIRITGTAEHRERIGISLDGGPFAPGATREATGQSEIEIVLALGESDGGGNGQYLVSGSPGPDTLTAGAAGIGLNADDDVDITEEQPATLAYLAGELSADTVSLAGGNGTGGPTRERPAKLDGGGGDDTLIGGPRGDNIYGGGGTDTVLAGGGNDKVNVWGSSTVHAGSGNDTVTAGGGGASVFGDDGDDVLLVRNGGADLADGGPGADSAQIDAGTDTTMSVETLLP